MQAARNGEPRNLPAGRQEMWILSFFGAVERQNLLKIEVLQ